MLSRYESRSWPHEKNSDDERNSVLRCKHILALLVFISTPGIVDAQDIENLAGGSPDSFLIGGLSEERTWLQEHGAVVRVFATNDYVGVVSGGIDRKGGIVGNFNSTVELDTDKLGLWEGGKALVYGVGVYGADPTKFVGDYQYTDNIEGIDQYILYQAWYSQTFIEDTLDVLMGVHDFNTDFAISEFALPLINSSFWLPVTISQRATPTFPTTGLGVRIKVQPTASSSIQYGIYDGHAGSPNRPLAWDIRLRRGDGAFHIGEVGYTPEGVTTGLKKVAVGAWYNSGNLVDNKGNPRSGNYGTYLLGDYQFTAEEVDSTQGLGFFLQLGQADAKRNQISRYFGTGFSCKGLIPDRNDDTAWLGLNIARNSSDFRAANQGRERSERVVEVGYRASLTPYLAISPDLQYVINPFMNPSTDNALVVMVRSEIEL